MKGYNQNSSKSFIKVLGTEDVSGTPGQDLCNQYYQGELSNEEWNQRLDKYLKKRYGITEE